MKDNGRDTVLTRLIFFMFLTKQKSSKEFFSLCSEQLKTLEFDLRFSKSRTTKLTDLRTS